MSLRRWMRHLFATEWGMRRAFDRPTLDAISRAIQDVEARHAGEIRFAVEAALDVPDLWRKITPRERAVHAFGQLGVWDTEANNGVLIYVLMADHDVEIVADRGLAQRVPHEDWENVCHRMEVEFRKGDFAAGAIAGVEGVGELLARHFPSAGADRDELPNQAVLL